MCNSPRFIYATKDLQEEIRKKYPDLIKYMSHIPLVDETVIVVTPVETPYVDSKGVLYVNTESFKFVLASLTELISSIREKTDVRLALEGFIQLLTKGEDDASCS